MSVDKDEKGKKTLTEQQEPARHDDEDGLDIAKGETKAVNLVKMAVILLLVAVAAVVSSSVYFYSHQKEQENFEGQFLDYGEKVLDSFRHNSFLRKEALDSFAQEIETFAHESNSTWPNVVHPNFASRAAFAILLSNVMSITFMPMVEEEDRERWETFAVQNQGWFQEGLDYVGEVTAKDDQENLQVLYDSFGHSEDNRIPERIHAVDQDAFVRDHTHMPWWQFYPAFPAAEVINQDVYSNVNRIKGFDGFFAAGTCITGPAWDASDPNNRMSKKTAAVNLFMNRLNAKSLDKETSYTSGPISDLYVSVKDGKGTDRKLVGALSADVYWQVYFENVLPANAHGVEVVLENSCNQAYTFGINGQEAVFLGAGDLHDTSYDHLEISTGLGAFLGKYENPATLHEGHCIYGIRVYPSKTLEDEFLTNEPLNFTMILVATFVITCAIFLIYDCLVERRQKTVMHTAVLSTAVVQSLFPAAVREHLYDDAAAGLTRQDSSNHSDRTEDDISTAGEDDDSVVIAETHPHCTVLFADIAGFTAWSANRQPTEVFRMLETIYGAFDEIARRREVFKIETIGDCYVAVTGLPTAQPDHAIIAAEFAIECMKRLKELLSVTLVKKFGAGTENLTMRFGLHSGPVTAGVLRGDRARYQLFGDTVNTASRIESTGVKGRIHASESTASILKANGKGDWVVSRQDKVEAKGKGTLQTYWISESQD